MVKTIKKAMRKFSWGSFKYFWQIHLIVALCTAVATGVLAGALIVGDSVRGSLRSITKERLGTIQHALLADRFFPPDVLDRQNTVSAVLLNGTVVAPQTQTRASRVNIIGVTDNFFTFWAGSAAPRLDKTDKQPFNAIVINESLQKELNVQVGDTLLVNVPQAAAIHPEFLLGARDASEAIQSLRLVVSEIVPTENAGRFSLRAHQSLPLNAFIALPVLQKVLGQGNRINALFTAETAPISSNDLALSIDALDLEIQEHGTYFDVQSQQYLLKPIFSDFALTVAAENRISTLPTLTYLANTISANGRTVPYSTIVALPIDKGEFSELLNRSVTGSENQARNEMEEDSQTSNAVAYPQGILENPEIILNTWTATDLGVEVGDEISVAYYRVGAGEEYITETALFRLKGILPIEGITADRDLIPTFPGIHETADMSEWESPFPIDYTLIRSKDEAYWDEYGATPKAFISLETGKQLWRNRFGDLTAIRMGIAPNSDLQATRTLFETEFLKKIQPEQIGFQFVSLQTDGLQASAGATDFGMLFSSLSAFIIIAVALLVGMLFRIGVEQRSREIGILQAVGYPLTKIRRRFLYEGGIIAGIGSLCGCLLAVGYAQLMIFGLQTWWLPAIGTPFMELYVSVWSLLIGALISLAVVILSIRLTVRKVGKTSTVSLLAGKADFVDGTVGDKSKSRWMRPLSWLAAAIGVGVGIWVEQPVVSLLFVALLVIGIGAEVFNKWLRSQNVTKPLNRVRFAIRNAARQPGRSKTCVTTISIACCIIVAVGANRHDAPPETEYAFVAESALPLHHNLNTPDGRFELGFSDNASELLSASEVIPFRVLPGEDVSCLNLYQPQKPQILGASDAMLDGVPWVNLHLMLTEKGKVPAIGDEKSLRWILHHDPNDDFIIQDEFGKPLHLELETVVNSLFQSQLIISETNFTKYFPSQSGYQFFLIKTLPALRAETAQVLEETLGDYGFDLASASARLASYRAVENTYISTFQSLGGLGVLLGTFGLALVLFRNIIERRGELATLRAFGFRRQALSWMLFLESCFLLLVGMLIGIIAGLASIFASQGHLPSFPWFSLTITLLFIFGFGIIANAVAVAVALRSPLLTTLKSDF
ncbi:MAG: FtsX-like permease family protein [Candidatus Poribacteria bacterium]|nr:FtsX-like permease family protein [Candidatus Poribacteria bacterium]